MAPDTTLRWVLCVAIIGTGVFGPATVRPALAADDPTVQREVRELLDRVSVCYRNRDARGLCALFAPVPGLVTLGANPAGSAIGHAETTAMFQRFFDQVKRVESCSCRPYGIDSSGDVAWLAADLGLCVDFGAGAVPLDGRFTAVLRKVKGRWLFVQTHYSLPAARPAPAPAAHR